MSRNAEIRGVDYVFGGLMGIIIFITVCEFVQLTGCWLESPKDRIRLGWPTDFEGDRSVVPWALQEENCEEINYMNKKMWKDEEFGFPERMEEEETLDEIVVVSFELGALVI
ncbi:Hypothetical predicted protein [Paramuricea clavata]|uniref:Uncharacterized protein n=1 Tax=Paramuricea clavata TaxID=317549 RepID=A0A7D9HF10_PARCT|nr:Hypothetical predicted protein [Paramuricea clavata]